MCLELNYVRCTKLCAELCALYPDCISGTEPFSDAEDPNKACLSHGYRQGKSIDYGGLHAVLRRSVGQCSGKDTAEDFRRVPRTIPRLSCLSSLNFSAWIFDSQ